MSSSSETLDWRALAEPFAQNEVKVRKGPRNTRLSYITARQVMNRLDQVIGPANWSDSYREVSGGVVCALAIRIGDEWVVKEDIGTESDIEGDKGRYSGALKRAAVKWGIGRELYDDGTAWDDEPRQPQGQQPATPAPTANGSANGIDKDAFFAYAKERGLNPAQALEALGVKSLSDYQGTKEAAAAAVLAASTVDRPKA